MVGFGVGCWVCKKVVGKGGVKEIVKGWFIAPSPSNSVVVAENEGRWSGEARKWAVLAEKLRTENEELRGLIAPSPLF
jgi:hypothetical protein